MNSFTLSRLFFTRFEQLELFSTFLSFRRWFRPNIVQLMCFSLAKMMNSTPLIVCVMFQGIDLLRWNGILVIRQFSKIFTEVKAHHTGCPRMFYTVFQKNIKNIKSTISLNIILIIECLIYALPTVKISFTYLYPLRCDMLKLFLVFCNG